MQTATLWAPAVTYTVHSWCCRSTFILPVIHQETFSTLFCNSPTAYSWQHLAFIVVKYLFTQSAKGHNGPLVSTRRQVLNTMHEIIVNSTQMDSHGRRKCFPVSPVQVQAQQCHLFDSSSIKIPQTQPVPCLLGEEKLFPPLKSI